MHTCRGLRLCGFKNGDGCVYFVGKRQWVAMRSGCWWASALMNNLRSCGPKGSEPQPLPFVNLWRRRRGPGWWTRESRQNGSETGRGILTLLVNSLGAVRRGDGVSEEEERRSFGHLAEDHIQTLFSDYSQTPPLLNHNKQIKTNLSQL